MFTRMFPLMKRICRNLWEKIISFFKTSNLNEKLVLNNLNTLRMSIKKVSHLGKHYLLAKIHKRLHSVPGRPVISNCGTPTEKASEFVDYHFKPIMQSGKSYIKDSGDFINKIKSLQNISEGAIGRCSRPLSQYSTRGWFEGP